MFALTTTANVAKSVAIKSASAAIRSAVVPAASLTVTKRALATISPDIFPLQTPRNTQIPPVTTVIPGKGLPRAAILNEAPAAVAEPPVLPASFRLKNGQHFEAVSFGAPLERISGEVVFTTSLVGYPESMTDPSYRGQILVFTQPLIGNYGVPAPSLDQWGLLEHFESDHIQVKAIIVNDYATKYSHWNAIESLGQWCARSGVVALSGVDTRAVVTLLRDGGSQLGEIRVGESSKNLSNEIIFEDPNVRNLAAEVSVKSKRIYNSGAPVKVALIDCGVKQNIIRCLVSRNVEVHVVPWDHDLVGDQTAYDGVFISNGPGNPRHLTKTAMNLRSFMNRQNAAASPIPIFGICMGNQMLGMAAGFDIYKLPYGNRGHNQPAIDLVTGKCVITSQNHGYALNDTEIIEGWAPFFRNANDGTNEGIRHISLPYSSVQFHPEAKGGPMDTEYLFEEFVQNVRHFKAKREGSILGVLNAAARTSATA